MSWEIIFHRDSRYEFDEAYDFYESKQIGLGEDFAKGIQDEIDSLSMNLKIHARVYRDVRKAVVHRFPYCIYYTIESDRVRIISVFHAKRDPNLWKNRVEDVS